MQALTHPIDVVKKRYQVTGLQRPLTYGKRIDSAMTQSLTNCVRHIWRHEGVSGFYKGLSPSLIKVRCKVICGTETHKRISMTSDQHRTVILLYRSANDMLAVKHTLHRVSHVATLKCSASC